MCDKKEKRHRRETTTEETQRDGRFFFFFSSGEKKSWEENIKTKNSDECSDRDPKLKPKRFIDEDRKRRCLNTQQDGDAAHELVWECRPKTAEPQHPLQPAGPIQTDGRWRCRGTRGTLNYDSGFIFTVFIAAFISSLLYFIVSLHLWIFFPTIFNFLTSTLNLQKALRRHLCLPLF